ALGSTGFPSDRDGQSSGSHAFRRKSIWGCLDDAELRARNERVERSRRSKEARPQSPRSRLTNWAAAPRPYRRRSQARLQFEQEKIAPRLKRGDVDGG